MTVRVTCAAQRELLGARATSPQTDPQDAPLPVPTVVYWHRDMPPLDAEAAGEYLIEAASGHVPGTIAHRDDLWNRCYDDLMAQAGARLEQEVRRLGGDYAHVFDEAIETRRDDGKGETWLRGRFSYVLYRRQTVDRTSSVEV